VPPHGRRHGRSVRVGADRSAVGAGAVVKRLRAGAHGQADGGDTRAPRAAPRARIEWRGVRSASLRADGVGVVGGVCRRTPTVTTSGGEEKTGADGHGVADAWSWLVAAWLGKWRRPADCGRPPNSCEWGTPKFRRDGVSVCRRAVAGPASGTGDIACDDSRSSQPVPDCETECKTSTDRWWGDQTHAESCMPHAGAGSPVPRGAPTPAACGAIAPVSRRVEMPTPAAPSCITPRRWASPSTDMPPCRSGSSVSRGAPMPAKSATCGAVAPVSRRVDRPSPPPRHRHALLPFRQSHALSCSGARWWRRGRARSQARSQDHPRRPVVHGVTGAGAPSGVPL